MPQVTTITQQNIVQEEQSCADLLIALNAKITDVIAFYTANGSGAGLTDAAIQALASMQQISAATATTFISNLQSVQAAITPAILQNAMIISGKSR